MHAMVFKPIAHVKDESGTAAGRGRGRCLTVPAELARSRVADVLRAQWPDSDSRFWRQALRAGAVTVNGRAVHPQHPVAAGDEVWIAFEPDAVPRWQSPSAPRVAEPTVLHRDAALLVADKPAGMPTVPDRAGKDLGVYGWLKEREPGEDLRIVHRLDRDTSGCLVLARGLEAARALERAFRTGEVHKEYLALVEGVVRRPHLEIDRPLGPDRRRPGLVRVVPAGAKGARQARTVATVVERFRQHTLLRVEPKTGRSHQIRVHLSSLGWPVVGDADYGSGLPLLLSRLKPGFKLRRGRREPPLLRRMFLHAAAIELPPLSALSALSALPAQPSAASAPSAPASADGASAGAAGAAAGSPGGGERLRVEAPLPRDLQMVLDKLRKFASRQREGAEGREGREARAAREALEGDLPQRAPTPRGTRRPPRSLPRKGRG
jgi:RluA family pseudouridine synthase